MPSTFTPEAGRFLSALRKESGWSRRELARRLQYCGTGDIAALERSEMPPSDAQLLEIAALFWVTPQELLAGKRSTPEDDLPQEVRIRKEIDSRQMLDRVVVPYKNAAIIAIVMVIAGILMGIGFNYGERFSDFAGVVPLPCIAASAVLILIQRNNARMKLRHARDIINERDRRLAEKNIGRYFNTIWVLNSFSLLLTFSFFG